MKLLQTIKRIFRRPKPVPTLRMYSAAKNSRLTSGWGSMQTSADSEIMSSLRPLRARSRESVRDEGFARRAKVIVVNNVIGSGIGMQAQVRTTRDGLNTRINDDIEKSFETWSLADNCHTGGELHFNDMERLAMGQVFEAGEVFLRKHYRPFGGSTIPYALEVIEPERVIDEFQPSPLNQMARVRMGVETDEYHRPIAYWIRKLHPGEVRLTAVETDRLERVPASQIIHLRIIERWPQTRGVPWMHAVLRKLNDTGGYSEAEIVRARGAANYMATIETDEEVGVAQEGGEREIELSPGLVERLNPGEEMKFHATNSPNPTAEPFLRYMLREIAAGIGVSYESLSRDYSQSNYSSSRLSLLDDRDLWRVFQMWFLRSFRQPVHRDFLQAAVLSRAIPSISVEQYALDPERYQAVRFKPRGWSWVDPTKEVEAYKEAIKAGFTTRTDVIAQTANGRDVEDIDNERRQELDEAKAKDLLFDTDPELIKADMEAKKQPPPPRDNGQDLKKISDKQDEDKKDADERFRTLERIQHRHHADLLKAMADKQMTLNLGDTIVNNTQPAVTVPVDARTHLTVPEREVKVENHNAVTVPEREVKIENKHDITIPEREVKIDNHNAVTVPEREVRIEAPVTVGAPDVHVHQTERKGKRSMKLKGPDGKIIRTVEVDE